MSFHRWSPGRLVAIVAASVWSAFFAGAEAQAATPFVWKGHTWNVTSGGMAGVADGSPSNVSIDNNGYLHLKITNTNGTWTASELFTTDNLGFGTYQWQVDGPIDVYDKNVVLGFFPYGPVANIGKDGTNEIDIEFSRWGQANGPNADWTDYPSSGKTQGETSFSFSLGGGTLSTSRFVWTSASIEDFLMTGIQPLGSTTGLIKSWTYAPTDSMVDIPQQAMPLGINLWCFAIPSDGKDEEVVIRDFAFLPEGAAIPDAGTGADSDADAGAGANSGAGAGAGANSDSGAGADTDAAPATTGADAAPTGSPDDAASRNPSAGAPSSSGCTCAVAPRARPDSGLVLLLAVPLAAGRRARRGARRSERGGRYLARILSQ